LEQETKKAGMDPRFTIILLVLLFVVPVGTAIVLHSVGDGWRPGTTVNYGDLVHPVRPLNDFDFTSIDGKQVDKTVLQDKWTFMYLDNRSCDETCEKNLYAIRQSRLGQGGEKDRVQRIMVIVDSKEGEALDKVLEEHAGMLVLKPNKTMQKFISTFEVQDALPAMSAQRIYLVDPFGNLMMSYPAGVSPRDLVKDLERLLKYSKNG